MTNTREIPSGNDTVQYRKAKLWQIILVAFNAFNGMAVYFLIGLASYSASIGYGIATVAVGGLLTFTRIFDAITDPLLAFIYDRFNTRFGKVRPLMLIGWAIQTAGLVCMFNFFSSKGHGIPTFLGFYLLYVIGYTIVNMTAQTLPALMTNDPKQRPTVGVWQTVLNYLTPMALNIIVYTKLMPAMGGSFNQEFLNVTTWMCVAISFVGVLLVCIGISEYDRPENFRGIRNERLKVRDMVDVLKNNRPLQSYILSAASDSSFSARSFFQKGPTANTLHPGSRRKSRIRSSYAAAKSSRRSAGVFSQIRSTTVSGRKARSSAKVSERGRDGSRSKSATLRSRSSTSVPLFSSISTRRCTKSRSRALAAIPQSPVQPISGAGLWCVMEFPSIRSFMTENLPCE